MADTLDLPALLGSASPPLRGPGGERASLPPSLIGDPSATLGLYFSASWCPPCRAFTPKLSAAYTAMMKKVDGGGGGQGESLPPRELVFVSADRTQQEYETYATTMPFPALPYDDGARERLMQAVRLSGVPCLVIVAGDGRVLQREGRACVARDPLAAGWPWEGEAGATGVLGLWGSIPQAAQWVIMALVYTFVRWALGVWRGVK